MVNSSRRLGEFLVDRKVLSRDTLEETLKKEADEGISLTAVLLRDGLVGEKDLVAAVAAHSDQRFIDLAEHFVTPDLASMIPAELALRHIVVAVDWEGADLVVAMADPNDERAVNAIEEVVGCAVRPAMAIRSELHKVITALYGQAPGTGGSGKSVRKSDGNEGSPETPADFYGEEELHLDDLLLRVLDLDGSDLHLAVGCEPSVRVHGELKRLTEFPVMNGSEIRRMVYSVLTQRQREKFEEELELDTSHAIPGHGRFRVNVFLQRDSVGAVLRVIPYEIVPLGDLGLPLSVANMAEYPRGLVLVTGPTGSGKSTTLASLVDLVNRTKPVHIMTVEDPVEFLHHHKKALVNQREVGEDTHSFAEALRRVLRQDPDVILVGEMRDLETIQIAITAAETGHLVFGTLHTQDAPQSIDRMIDVFPAHQQQQVKVQLASSLQGIVTQQLVPKAAGKGRVVAVEVLVATPAVRNLIREGKTHQIYSSMQSGSQFGMQTMDQSLANLVMAGSITMQAALDKCSNPADLRRLAGRT
ncbi:MAG: PilT/PilU family type 4a pilus ATPase [Acidimicrobiales bacterium]